MIRVEGLRKGFQTRTGLVQAVDGVSFEAADGQITGLLGPNGAGKTTTLRMLYTLMAPDSGRVLVDGLDAAIDPTRVREHLGVLPDARGIYKRLTARENIAYFGALQGLDDRLIAERTKTAIARALVHAPRNVLLDEPTNGLDVMTTRALRSFLLEQRAAGRCVLLSTHIMQEVARLCDRIVVMAHGRVVADGTSDELREATGCANLEDAFVKAIGSDEGLFA
jgi:sodium transport system ATP-binding protein